MASELTRPVPPKVYGSSEDAFGWFWKHNFDKLMEQAQRIERERDELVLQLKSMSTELNRLERLTYG